MLLFLLAYLGGALTIVSPCILPVLPFVFARAGQPFLKSTLPMLAGMAATFAVVATLAAVGGSWAVEANRYGRAVALVLLAGFGLILLFPALSDMVTRPLVALGARLSESADRETRQGGSVVAASLLLGVATGLLWAPCAGPVLGLILTGAALNGANLGTSLLLLAYALGAATSLALALVVGGRVFKAMKQSLHVGEWVRRGLGAAVILAAIAIGLGADTGFLTQASLASTNALEQGLVDKLNMTPSVVASPTTPEELPVEATIPKLDGAVEWINSPPLTIEGLKCKVVLIDFWTYSCINCLRALPYVEAWAQKYKDEGLVVIGVHAPEFAFEKDLGNVKKAVSDLGITYPVAVDNNYAIWRQFENHYWPAHYFIDAKGQVRHHHYGEGSYDESEKVIQKLLAEAGHSGMPSDLVDVAATGAQAASDYSDVKSPETYIGHDRASNFVSVGGIVKDKDQIYTVADPKLNEWGLSGGWNVGAEHATSTGTDSSITFRFHARDLHLVLGPGADGKPVRFQVLIDGKAPADSHGTDIDAAGNGTVTEQRLYQLIRQSGTIADHTFEIRFTDPGVQAYAFTFG